MGRWVLWVWHHTEPRLRSLGRHPRPPFAPPPLPHAQPNPPPPSPPPPPPPTPPPPPPTPPPHTHHHHHHLPHPVHQRVAAKGPQSGHHARRPLEHAAPGGLRVERVALRRRGMRVERCVKHVAQEVSNRSWGAPRRGFRFQDTASPAPSPAPHHSRPPPPGPWAWCLLAPCSSVPHPCPGSPSTIDG